MLAGDFADDGEAEAAAIAGAGRRPVEALENALTLGFGDAAHQRLFFLFDLRGAFGQMVDHF
jgi:hypothetical protein